MTKKSGFLHLLTDRRGNFLLEPLIAATLFAAFLVFFLGSFRNIFSTQDVIWQRTRASLLAQESVESAYNWLVNSDWEEAYQEIETSEQYTILPGDFPIVSAVPEQIDSTYARVLRFSPIFRDSVTHAIVPELNLESYLDKEMLEVTATTFWNYQGKVIEVQYHTLVSNPRAEVGS